MEDVPDQDFAQIPATKKNITEFARAILALQRDGNMRVGSEHWVQGLGFRVNMSLISNSRNVILFAQAKPDFFLAQVVLPPAKILHVAMMGVDIFLLLAVQGSHSNPKP